MIKVTAPNGTPYEFADADDWEIYGPGLRVYQGQDIIAEFAAFLLVQKMAPVEDPEVPAV